MEAVADCDILLALSNGNAGWAKGHGDIGICHAELMTGLFRHLQERSSSSISGLWFRRSQTRRSEMSDFSST